MAFPCCIIFIIGRIRQLGHYPSSKRRYKEKYKVFWGLMACYFWGVAGAGKRW